MNELAKLENATRMLAEVRDAHGAKDMMVMASAAEHYARKAKLGDQAVNYAHSIKIDAERLLGGFLRETEKNTGTRGQVSAFSGGTKAVPPGDVPTLADLGLSKKLSAESQALHAIAEKSPEQFQAIRTGTKTIQDIKAEIKQERKAAIVESIAAEPPTPPKGPFRVIVVDPPWKYESRAEDPTHRARNPYPDMELADIKALPIPALAHTDCILWLWTTNAFMREAFECLDAWGFENKTILTWTKSNLGLGNWLRGKTEHCLMAVRGKPIVTLTNQTTHLVGPLREHSRKPDEFFAMVESLCPGNKLEMFSRQKRDGWQSTGAEENHFADE